MHHPSIEKVNEIVLKTTRSHIDCFPQDYIQLTSNFIYDLELDSIEILDIVYDSEEQFGVHLSQIQEWNVKTVGSLAEDIWEKCK